MKKIIIVFSLLVLIFSVSALSFPKLSGRVVDEANIFSRSEESQLTSLLLGLEKDSNIQAVVVSVKSLEGYAVEDYTVRLAEDWKIGSKASDNGLILLVAPNERDVRIEVGYGLEHKLTDGMSGYIIRQDIIPNFRGGNYFTGVKAGLITVNNVMTGKTTISQAEIQRSQSREKKGSSLGYIIFLIIISLLFRGRLFPMLLLGSMFGGGRGGRGGFGGGSGGFGGGGFSGGGGGFGGGGASGSW
jgi:uncharacterized protein